MEAGTEERKSTASSPLQHPMRIRILEVANARPISPVRFVELALEPKPLGFEEQKKALSFVSYHFRALAMAGCIELVETVPRRGSVEHIYRGTARAYFSDEEWAELPQHLRCKISTTMLQGLIASAEGSMLAHRFDDRTDRWLTWTRANLDERGWSEMTDTMAESFAKLERIREEAESRITETQDDAIPTTFGLLGFEARPALEAESRP